MSTVNDKRVIVVTGDSAISAEQVRQMLGDKAPDHEYEILTNSEAIERGLMLDDIGQVLPAFGRTIGAPLPYPHLPRGDRAKPHPERDRWNAAVDAKKAAKRRAKEAA